MGRKGKKTGRSDERRIKREVEEEKAKKKEEEESTLRN